jgi:hypothetical protein
MARYPKTEDGSYIDDGSALFTLAHGTGCALGDGKNTSQIGINNARKIGLGHIDGGRRQADASVVDHDVEPCAHHRKSMIKRGTIGHIEGKGFCLAPFSDDPFGGLINGVGLTRGENNMGAMVGEHLSEMKP